MNIKYMNIKNTLENHPMSGSQQKQETGNLDTRIHRCWTIKKKKNTDDLWRKCSNKSMKREMHKYDEAITFQKTYF